MTAVFTPATLAEQWGCSETHVRNLIASGELQAWRLGAGMFRITAEAAAEFVARPPGQSSVVAAAAAGQGEVYFIACSSFVKIGAALNVPTRLASLQRANPLPLTLLATELGYIERERALHQQFAQYRHRDEWFRHEGPLAEYIAALAGEPAG